VSNTAVVQAIYQAFVEGRIEDVVAAMTHDVIWIVPGTQAVPWAGTWLGPDRVRTLLVTMAEMREVDAFEVRQLIEAGDTVVALGHIDAQARASGAPFASDWAMVWKLRDGKVCFHQAYQDTGEFARAFRRPQPSR
jgi:ketosteroid isomerase-like protein